MESTGVSDFACASLIKSLNFADHCVFAPPERNLPNFVRPGYSKLGPASTPGVHPHCTARGQTNANDTMLANVAMSRGKSATVWNRSMGYTQTPNLRGLNVEDSVGDYTDNIGDGEKVKVQCRM
jgi:hypothetical protein